MCINMRHIAYRFKVSKAGEIMAENRFAFVTEKNVQNVRENRTPLNTQKHTMWSRNVYRQWAEARNKEFNEFVAEDEEFRRVPDLDCLTIRDINYWLSRFAVEVRKKDRGEYRHEVLYSLFCGLNRTVESLHPNKNVFRSAEFKPLQQALDGKLKELQASQNTLKRKADAECIEDEAKMWECGVLGTSCPESVLNTLLFLSGKLFALRGGKEQREMTHDQLQFCEQEDGKMVVKYSEKVSKTNQGGLKRRRQEVKSVEHIEDPTDERSWNFLYHFYLSKLYSTV